MARSVETARGFYIRQRDQGFVDAIPAQSVGIAQLKDEVRFGLMPIGTVFPVMVNIAGAYAPPSSGVVQDGFMRADGAAIPPGNALSGNTPDLTGSRFLMGTNGSGVGANPNAGATGGNANNMKTLSTPELPSHTHPAGTYNAPHAHPAPLISGSTGPHGHSASASVPSASSSHQHQLGWDDVPTPPFTSVRASGGSDRNNGVLTPNSSPSGSHSHPGASVSVVDNPGVPSGTLAVGTTSVPLTGSSGSQGSGDSFSILPQYVATVYLIRVK